MSTTTEAPAKRNGQANRLTLSSKLMDCPACDAAIMIGYSGELGITTNEAGSLVAEMKTVTGTVIRHDCRARPR